MARLGVALVNVSMGNPYARPHVIRPFEYPPPDGYETPEHPLIGVDRHFRLTAADPAGLTPTCRSSAAATATCRSICSTPGRRTCATAASPSSASAGRRCRSRTSPGSPAGARPARPQARLPDLQLLHRPDAGQAQRTGPVRHRLPAVRQGGVRADLGRGPTGPAWGPGLTIERPGWPGRSERTSMPRYPTALAPGHARTGARFALATPEDQHHNHSDDSEAIGDALEIVGCGGRGRGAGRRRRPGGGAGGRCGAKVKGWRKGKGWGWVWGKDDEIGSLNALTDQAAPRR